MPSKIKSVEGPNLRVAEIERAPGGSASFYTLGLPPRAGHLYGQGRKKPSERLSPLTALQTFFSDSIFLNFEF